MSLQDSIEAIVAEFDATDLPVPSPRDGQLLALPGNADASGVLAVWQAEV